MGKMESGLTVHLYSFIEPIDVHLKEALPSVNLKHVKFPGKLMGVVKTAKILITSNSRTFIEI